MKTTVATEVQVEYEYHEAEKPTHDYPGAPAYIELLTVKLGGQAVNLDYMWIAVRQELEEACMEEYAERMEAARAKGA